MMWNTSPRWIKQVAIGSLLAGLTLTYLVLGSGEWKAVGSDAAYLRPPAPISAPVNARTLFPLQPAARWSLKIEKTGDSAQAQTQLQVQTQVIEHHTTPAGEVVVTRTSFGKTETGRRIYLQNRRGVSLVAIGDGVNAYFRPPLPFLLFPLQPGRIYLWQGVIRKESTQVPCTAAIRLDGPDTITTHAGAFTAYRVDLMLQSGKAPHINRLHTTLWVSPEVGMVREQHFDKDTPTLTELVSYALS